MQSQLKPKHGNPHRQVSNLLHRPPTEHNYDFNQIRILQQ